MNLSPQAVVIAVSTRMARRSSRRSFLAKTAVVGSALAVNPVRFLLRPGTAYASLCGPEADCASGWTVFCCSINEGSNTCPPGTIAAGWWKSDNSGFCGGGPRYILDCNATCGTCSCGPSGICGPECWSCECHCGTGSCDERLVCCNRFRYGQCHQEVACVGPVVCRVATCRPPWEFDDTCTTTSATANATALHTAPCLDGAVVGVGAFGAAADHGALDGHIRYPVVGMEATPTGAGYWLVAADGGIFAFGDAQFFGSTGGIHLNREIVDMAATQTGAGYWLVAADGGIFAFGDAQFFGSTGGTRLNRSIVGMARTASGAGYWLVASDGGIFAYGDAQFFGSTGGTRLNRSIVGMAPTPTNQGYWLVASDGGIFAFGDARFFGSLGDGALPSPVTGIAATPTGAGYWLVATDGSVYAFGDATFFGSLGTDGAARGRATDIAARPGGDGYWIATS